MNQYAYTGKGKTIHSSGQWEMYKNKVDDRSSKVGGTQSLKTLDGYQIPMSIQKGLPYFGMSPPTNQDLEDYPYIIVMNDDEWNRMNGIA